MCLVCVGSCQVKGEEIEEKKKRNSLTAALERRPTMDQLSMKNILVQ